MELQQHRGLIRIALIYLAVTIGWLAVWILAAPKGFYDTFPGGGTHLVSALPPYNEHLTTTSHYSTGDNIASLFGLALDVLLPLAILYLASDRAQRRVQPA